MGNAAFCPGCGAIIGGWDDDDLTPCDCETGIDADNELARLRAKCNRLAGYGTALTTRLQRGWGDPEDVRDWYLHPGDLNPEPDATEED